MRGYSNADAVSIIPFQTTAGALAPEQLDDLSEH